MNKTRNYLLDEESKVQTTERGSQFLHPFDIIMSRESAEIVESYAELAKEGKESQDSKEDLGELIEKAMEAAR